MKKQLDIPEAVIAFGTPRQQEIARLVNELGNPSAAAKKLGVDRRYISRAIESMRSKAMVQGVAPEYDLTHPIADTQYLKGSSTLYDNDGNLRLQWIKTNAKVEKLEAVAKMIVDELGDRVAVKKNIPRPKGKLSPDLLTVYPIGDAHLGLYCWHEDSEESWDVRTGEDIIRAAFDRLTEQAPPSDYALIANVGDLFHADNSQNRTERSGASLDVDSRWHHIVRVGVRSMIYAIDRALEAHKHVTVINEIGNHDERTSYMLSLALERHYAKNDRCTIDVSPLPYHRYRFGKNLIGVHHGHLMNADTLYRVMAEDWAEDWGETIYRMWITGHIHHKTVKEIGSMVIESFRTLIPKDAYHTGMGYRSGRDIQAITIHRSFGEWSRRVVNIDYLRSTR